MRFPIFQRSPTAYDDEFMDKMASVYLDRTAWTRLRLAAVEDLVQPHKGERVLDLGSAAGAITDFLTSFGCRVVGVDSSPRAVAMADSLFPRWDFVVADVAHLPFSDAS